MGNLRSLFARRRRGSSFAAYVTVATMGLLVGMAAWGMSHPAPVTFGTSVASPTQTGTAAPASERPRGEPIPDR